MVSAGVPSTDTALVVEELGGLSVIELKIPEIYWDDDTAVSLLVRRLSRSVGLSPRQGEYR
jgi:hypothetical protein